MSKTDRAQRTRKRWKAVDERQHCGLPLYSGVDHAVRLCRRARPA